MNPGQAIRYLTVQEVVGIHADLMARGGYPVAPLVRPDNLDSAVLRPQTAAHYGGANLVQQGASLGLGLSQAQAFLDGNKRVAFGAMDVFLRLNGCRYTGDPVEVAERLTGYSAAIANRQTTMDDAVAEFAGWIEAHCTW